jgi:hypothetical protein
MPHLVSLVFILFLFSVELYYFEWNLLLTTVGVWYLILFFFLFLSFPFNFFDAYNNIVPPTQLTFHPISYLNCVQKRENSYGLLKCWNLTLLLRVFIKLWKSRTDFLVKNEIKGIFPRKIVQICNFIVLKDYWVAL